MQFSDPKYVLGIWLKGLIRFCHSARKTKSLKLDLKIKDGILCSLKNHRVLSTNNEHLRISSLCLMASFNSKSNFNIFICFWKWQNLIGPFCAGWFLMSASFLLSEDGVCFLTFLSLLLLLCSWDRQIII